MSVNCYLDSGARRVAARHSDGASACLSAPIARHRQPAHRVKEHGSQPKLMQRSGCAFLGSSARHSMKVSCYAQADQLNGLKPSGPSSLAERIFDESYKIGELLGIGSFGKVYRATHRSGAGLDYAVKMVSKHREGFLDERVARRIHEEIDTLRQLQGRPEVVRLIDTFEDNDRVWIVTELCSGGDLEHFIKDYGRMTEAEAAHAAHDILQVLAECHRQGICYADVKPANFLLTRPYRRSGQGEDSRLLELRTTDFGCSQRIQESGKLNKRTGTPLYMAPELFMRYYGVESDQWALGIMMYQMLSGHLPFWNAQSDRSPFAVMSAILNAEVRFDGPEWESVSEEATNFLSQLLDRDYNSRLTASDALQHPWIAKFCGGDECAAPENLVQRPPATSEQLL